MTDWNRRDLMRGVAGAAALSGLVTGAAASAATSARAQTTGSGEAAASVDRAVPFELGNGMASPPGDAIPNDLVGRPLPKRFTPPDAPDERVGWAIAGLGDFAVNHIIPALDGAQHSRLAGLVSGNAEKAGAVARSRGIEQARVHTYETMDRIADDDAIEVVYVITPNALHEEVVVRALRAGKHVLCEKPMGATVEACERMIAEAERADRKLMIAYRAHFEPHNIEAKRMFDAGEFGTVNFMEAATHRPLDVSRPRDQWRVRRALSGGGSMPDIGIYALNGVLYYLDEMPVRLAARTYAPDGDARFAEVEDVCAAELVFPSGRVAHISSSYTAFANRIVLHGDKALATLSPATSYHDNRLIVAAPDGTERTIGVAEQSDVQFHREMDHLSQAIREGSDVRTPASMGLRDVRLIEAIYTSATRGAWVDLDGEGRVKA